MAWSASWYVVLLLASGVVNAVLAFVVWTNRDRRAAGPAMAFFCVMALWAFADAVRVGFTDPGAQFFWYRVAITPAGAVATLWLVFALVYAGYEDVLTRPVLALLSVKPVTYVALAWTNGAHHLVWTDVWLLAGASPPNLAFAFGPVYVVHIVYAYLLVVAGVGVLLDTARRSAATYRQPVALAVAAVLPPFAANVGFVLGVTPSAALDLTPVAFALTGVIFAVALFEYDLLNRAPIAREQLLNTLGSGFVVTNAAGRVVHRNDVGRSVAPAASVGADAASALGVGDLADLDGDERRREREGRDRWYDVHVSPLADFRDRPVGHLVAFQDVTERRASQQRLAVTNRLLRHNLRNASAKLVGWAENVAAATDREGVAADAARIEREAEDLAELGERARHIDATLEASGPRETVALAAVLDPVVADVRDAWPSASVDLDVDDLAVVVEDRERLALAVRNLVENGVEHGADGDGRVSVTARRADDEVVLVVADDGPGLPPVERETLRRGSESPLTHSAGLGLWLARWLLEAVGGSVTVASGDGGTTVTVRLPAATSE